VAIPDVVCLIKALEDIVKVLGRQVGNALGQ
jgi:hypothetical protein